MPNPIPPPPLDGTNRDPEQRERDRVDHPERQIREARRSRRRHRQPDPSAPQPEPAVGRPNGESDRGLAGSKRSLDAPDR
jgi:hypothetical protein